jgi:hypothetical protein
MNGLKTCFVWTVVVLVLTRLSLMSQAFAGEPTRDENTDIREIDKLIDALANRNRPPRIVEVTFDWLALFDKNYDWKENARVHEVIGRIVKDPSPERWKRLVAHGKDSRYCLTLNDERASVIYNKNLTVGDICWSIAMYQLRYPMQNATQGIGAGERPIHLPLTEVPGLPEPGQRALKKSLVELQIAICEQAIKDLPHVAAAAKESARDARTDPATLKRCRANLEAAIEKLKKSKTGIFGSYRVMSAGYEGLSPAVAANNRAAYEEAKKRGEVDENPEGRPAK